MSQQILTIDITANTDKLKKGIADSKNELRNFGKDQENSSRQVVKSFKDIDKQLIDTQNQFKKANANALSLEGDLRKLSKQFDSGAISQKAYIKEQKEIVVALASSRQAAQQYQSRISSIKATQDQATNSTRSLGTSVGNLQGYANDATTGIRGAYGVTVEFSRVIQDLPYGIIGVGNNLQQLAGNWQIYAKNAREAAAAQGTTISTGGLLRNALGSLVSPLNLLTLGVSLVTAGWTAYTMWSQKSAKATKENKDKFDEMSKALSLNSSILLQASQASGEESAQLKILYGVATDATKSTNDRRKASEQLISKYPDLFKNIGQEGIMLGQAKIAYDKLTTSILATARAQAAYGKIGEKASQQLTIDETNDALREEIRLTKTAIEQNRAKAKSMRNNITNGSEDAVLMAQTSDALDRSLLLNGKIESIQSKITDNLIERAKLSEQITKLEGVAVDNQSKVIVKENDTVNNGDKEKIKLAKELDKLTEEITKGSLSSYDAKLFEINKKYEEIYSKVKDEGILKLAKENEEAEKLRVNLEKILNITNKSVGVTGAQSVSLSGTLNTNLPSSAGLLDSRAGRRAKWKNDAVIESESFSKEFTKSLRKNFAQSLTGFFDDLSSISQNTYDIEQRYNKLRADASADQIQALNKMEKLEKRINNGFTSMLTNAFNSISRVGSTAITSSISTGLSGGGWGDLTKMFKGDQKGYGYGALGGLAGGAISGLSKPTSTGGQVIGGALSGAGTGLAVGLGLAGAGAAIGSVVPVVGTIVGAAVGAIVGIFKSNAAKRQRELEELQLKEQQKQTSLQQRIAQLSYQSSIIGQMTNQGTVQGFDRDAFGNIVGRIDGKDILLVTERAKNMGS